MHKVLWAHEENKLWILDPSHSRNKKIQNPLHNTEGVVRPKGQICNQVRKKNWEDWCLETLPGSVDYHTLERCPFYLREQVCWSQMVKSIIEASDFSSGSQLRRTGWIPPL